VHHNIHSFFLGAPRGGQATRRKQERTEKRTAAIEEANYGID
jgi:hypothetical protein